MLTVLQNLIWQIMEQKADLENHNALFIGQRGKFLR